MDQTTEGLAREPAFKQAEQAPEDRADALPVDSAAEEPQPDAQPVPEDASEPAAEELLIPPAEPEEPAAAEPEEEAAAELEALVEVAEPIEVPEAGAIQEGAEPAEGEEGAEGEEAVPAEDARGDWYFVHTQSGYENKVKANLSTRIISMNMEEKIYEVVIPTEEVVEIKSGKKQLVQRKLFPGYLLVRMELDDDSWYVVRNTPGVTGFVGSTARPVPLTEKEVDKILQRKQQVERARPRLEFNVSDIVRVTSGPFANFQGVISEIDVDRSKLKVLVNIFGRETPVELGFDQVQKV